MICGSGVGAVVVLVGSLGSPQTAPVVDAEVDLNSPLPSLQAAASPRVGQAFLASLPPNDGNGRAEWLVGRIVLDVRLNNRSGSSSQGATLFASVNGFAFAQLTVTPLASPLGDSSVWVRSIQAISGQTSYVASGNTIRLTFSNYAPLDAWSAGPARLSFLAEQDEGERFIDEVRAIGGTSLFVTRVAPPRMRVSDAKVERVGDKLLWTYSIQAAGALQSQQVAVRLMQFDESGHVRELARDFVETVGRKPSLRQVEFAGSELTLARLAVDATGQPGTAPLVAVRGRQDPGYAPGVGVAVGLSALSLSLLVFRVGMGSLKLHRPTALVFCLLAVAPGAGIIAAAGAADSPLLVLLVVGLPVVWTMIGWRCREPRLPWVAIVISASALATVGATQDGRESPAALIALAVWLQAFALGALGCGLAHLGRGAWRLVAEPASP